MASTPLGYFQKSLSEDQSAVIVAVEARALVEDISKRISAFPPAMKHLGEAVLAAALMYALGDTSEEEKLELQWKCAGPFGHLYADMLGAGRVRATIQNPRPEVYDFNHNLGAGLMQARRVKGDFPANTGIVKSVGVVGEDVVSYLRDSEQKDCLLSIYVKIEWDKEAEARGALRPFKVVRADGFLINILPQSDASKKEDYISLWKQRIGVGGPLDEWAMPTDSSEALRFIFHILTVGSKPTLYKKESLSFDCTCSEDRAKRALSLLSVREKAEMSKNDEGITLDVLPITCEYCGNVYRIKV